MDVLLTLIPFVLLAGILLLANLEGRDRAFRWITYIALTLLNLLMILLGALGMLVSRAEVPGMSQATMAAYGALLGALGWTGLLAFLPFVRPLRILLARLIDINPDSAVHTTALVYAIYLVGTGLGQQPLLSDPAALEGLGGVGISSSLIWAQALGMILLAFAGIGLLVRRDWRQTLDRLGLKPLTLSHLGVGVAAIVGLFIFQIAVSLAWQALDPQGFAQIEDASSLLLGEFVGLGGALTIGLSAAIGEELVFRGAMLPPFRLLLTSLLFTVVHSQYALSPATLLILAIALVLGVLRYRTSLTVCILVHFGYNFLSVLLPNLGQ